MNSEKTNSVSRKPHFRGINSATDIPKAFRAHGNHLLMSSAVERKHKGLRGYVSGLGTAPYGEE